MAKIVPFTKIFQYLFELLHLDLIHPLDCNKDDSLKKLITFNMWENKTPKCYDIKLKTNSDRGFQRGSYR